MGQTTVGRKQVGVGEGMMALLVHLSLVSKRNVKFKYVNFCAFARI